MSNPLRIYSSDECGPDGYPLAWHKPTYEGAPAHGPWKPIKDIIRAQADDRCERCRHPYRSGEHGSGEWSPCDEECTHRGLVRLRSAALGDTAQWTIHDLTYRGQDARGARLDERPEGGLGVRWNVEAAWRILTVHHLNGDKRDCRWWNLAALCQRCHLSIQGRVKMEQVFPFEHSEWFKPHAAGYYAAVYLGEDLTRHETLARLDELLALELHA